MKKLLLLMLMLCVLLTGCGKEADPADANSDTVVDTNAVGTTINPLTDTTMDNLSDAIIHVSLEEGDAYVDDTGVMQMDVTVYSYDKYDMVDISMLKEGDILVTNGGEVRVESLERTDSAILINGGLSAGGFDLVTDESGIFFECGYNDAMNWYAVGEATIRVSVDFVYYDNADLDQGEVVYYPGSFLIGEVTDYHFTPHNTTIRVENGQIVEMNRRYVP